MHGEVMREQSTVLVADDAFTMRETLREILVHESDYRVIGEACDGLEVVEQVRRLQPEVVALDIVMPGQSGIAALRSILDVSPTTRVVVCSSLGQDELVAEAIHEGARGFVVKPFSPERTLRTFDRVTDRQQICSPPAPAPTRSRAGTALRRAVRSAKELLEALDLRRRELGRAA